MQVECEKCGEAWDFYVDGLCGVCISHLLTAHKDLLNRVAMLDIGYETGRNSDIESEEYCAIYEVTGSRNDRECRQVAVGRTTLESLQRLAVLGGDDE